MADESSYEKQVRAALCRVNAPEGFTDRLMSRAELRGLMRPAVGERAGVSRAVLQFTRPAWRAAYAAAALLAITAGTMHMERVRSDQRRADLAAAQFDTALQVTRHALNHVSVKLQTTEVGEVERALEANGRGR